MTLRSCEWGPIKNLMDQVACWSEFYIQNNWFRTGDKGVYDGTLLTSDCNTLSAYRIAFA